MGVLLETPKKSVLVKYVSRCILRHKTCYGPLRKEDDGSSRGDTSHTKKPLTKQHSINASEYLLLFG